MTKASMDAQTTEIATQLLKEVSNAKQYSQMPEPHELFMSAETILSGMAYLIAPMLDAENNFRADVAKFVSEGDSVAKATAKAQSGQSYKDHRRLKYVYDLCEMQTQMLKKFHGVLQDDYKRTK